MFKLYPSRSKEDLRAALEEGRNHIDTMWAQGNWFNADLYINGNLVETSDEAEYVPNLQDWVENSSDRFDEIKDFKPVIVPNSSMQAGVFKLDTDYNNAHIQVTGTCLVGSVLYALDYTSEQWKDQARVRPVVEALFNELPLEWKVPDLENNYGVHYKPGLLWSGSRSQYKKDLYDWKVGCLINFNDYVATTKEDVLNLFDRAIKTVIDRM